MQHDKTANTSLFILLTLVCSAGVAQELSLFEAVEIPTATVSDAAIVNREQRNLPNQPAFTLLGTSRIGDKRRASLVDSNGKVLRVEINQGDPTPIPGYDGYNILAFESGQLSIRLPEGMACLRDEDKGVECNADGLTQLSLKTAAPIEVANVERRTENVQTDATTSDDAAPENPFAAALRQAAQNEANAQEGRGRANNTSERFQARRIAPEDVPSGMRVVRTPFGDRLVEL